MDLETAHLLKTEVRERFARERPQAYAFERRQVHDVFISEATTGPGSPPIQTIVSEPEFGVGVALVGDGRCQLAIRYPWTDTARAPHLDDLEKMADGELHVEWTGPVVAHAVSDDWCREIKRPLQIGTSVAHQDGTAGTICAFVKRGEGVPELLSCNHVLALCDRGTAADPVWQPGPSDGGNAGLSVGGLSDAVPLDRRGVNLVDAALARVDDGILVDPRRLEGYGDLTGAVPPEWYGPEADRALLAKLGRTTGRTEGRIQTLSLRQTITYSDFGDCIFDELIEIKGSPGRFSDAGDSGSLVFEVAGSLGVGMVIAGSSTASYAIRLDTVLSRLGANLVV
jgi:hypothetical protein